MPSPTPPSDLPRNPSCPVLVLGVGNILLRDEGVGVRVVETLERMELPAGVELCDGGTAGLDLLDVLAERRKVIVVDAMDADCRPGTVLRLRVDELAPPGRQGVSLHDIGLVETLAAARLLDIAPQEIVILGVKPFDQSSGLELSPEMTQLLPRFAELVLAELALGA